MRKPTKHHFYTRAAMCGVVSMLLTIVSNAQAATGRSASGRVISANKTCSISHFQKEMLTLVNQARGKSRYCGGTFFSGARPLRWNGRLFNAAAGHANDMADNNYFSHTSQHGRTFSQRVTAQGYAWRATSENIAAGQTTIKQVMNAWLDSPGHCANIMNTSFVETGASCVKNLRSGYKQYWAMELAAPR